MPRVVSGVPQLTQVKGRLPSEIGNPARRPYAGIVSAKTPQVIAGNELKWVGPDGVWYAANAGTGIVTSLNRGRSWSVVLHTFAATISQIRTLAGGELLVTTNFEAVYKSTGGVTGTWAQVLTFQVGRTQAPEFGLDVYKHTVVVMEYGPKLVNANANQGYISTDDGATWRTFYIGPTTAGYHNHDVRIDPYRGLIWMTSGDDVGLRFIRWTEDAGQNPSGWHSYTVTEPDNEKFTQIMPLPECVLFASDAWHERIYRLDGAGRPASDALNLTLALEILPETVGTNAPFGTRAAVQYGENAMAVFGFLQFMGDLLLPTQIWSTLDGLEFHPLYDAQRLPGAGSAAAGQSISTKGVWGPDGYGDLVAYIIDDDGVNSLYGVVLPLFDPAKTVTIFDSVQPRVASTWIYAAKGRLDGEYHLEVQATLDQTVTIYAFTEDVNGTASHKTYQSLVGGVATDEKVVVSTGTQAALIYTSIDFPCLKGGDRILGFALLTSATPPTAGTVTLRLRRV